MAPFDDQHTGYRDNATPGVIRTLAEQLHVSAASLDALEIGWKIDDNAWVCPERDETGAVIGLIRRYWDGRKFAVAGSKRGLSFVPVAITEGYCRHRQTWKRVTEDEPCPICGRPDWCGVDGNCSPPRFVRCMRVSQGAVHEDHKSGFIHELIPGSFIEPNRIASPLAASEHPVLIVEGPSDVSAAFDLGFVAVGKPSNVGGLGYLQKLVHGRPVAVLGEQDRKADGSWPGRIGMEKTFEVLKDVCPEACKVLPPPDVKDLRNWVYEHGLTHEQLLAAIAGGDTEESAQVLDSSAPLDIATRWIAEEKTEGGQVTLRSWRRSWYEYNGHEYVELDTDIAIRGALYSWMHGKSYKHFGAKGDVSLKPLVPTRNSVGDVIDALTAICPVPDQPPCWLDGRQDPALANVIVFQNGILDTRRFLDGKKDYLLGSTPQLFHLSATPYPFDPEATCPGWLRFLSEVLKEDAQRIALLQEWFGYNMVADTSLEKFMLFVGRPGSGKSTVLEVLQAVLGSNQCANSSFGDLCSEFGRQPLIGKLSIILPDAHVPRNADKIQALEVIKSIVGRDGVTVNRKYLPQLPDVRLPGRITIAVNDLPDLTDHARALERRLLALHFSESFEGREDTTLKDRLPEEAPGIAVWALAGLRRLRRLQRFTIPAASEELLDEIRRALTPIAEFLDDCCVQGPNFTVPASQIYDCWVAWARARGLHPGVQSRFGRRLRHQLPHVIRARVMTGGGRDYWYEGLGIAPEAKSRYIGG